MTSNQNKMKRNNKQKKITSECYIERKWVEDVQDRVFYL